MAHTDGGISGVGFLDSLFIRLDGTSVTTALIPFAFGLSSAAQITSSVTTGTAPLSVSSTTKVTNLNADMTDGAHIGTSGGTIPLLNSSNLWSNVNTYSVDIYFQDTKGINFGASSEVNMHFESASSLFSIGQTYAGASALSLSFASISLTGTSITLTGNFLTSSDGNYNIGTGTTKFGIIYANSFSDGAITITTSNVVVKNAVNNFGTTNGVTFRASGQKINSPSASTLDIASTTTMNLKIGATTKLSLTTSALTFSDAVDIPVGSTTGTKFGTATTQKIGFFNATPIVQQTNTAGAVTAGATYTATEQAMLTDSYTVLRNLGLLS